MKALRDTFLRVDARSLGLFRILFGLVLLGDLCRRFTWARAFYSNEGVLPNHNHLFLLKEQGRVWSIFHALSTPGEAYVALTLIGVAYVLFTVGWATRVMHAVALVALVSLTGRNVLLEHAGSYAAIALLAFTLFLPLGRRFSIDALRRSLQGREEKGAADLNARVEPADPGASPVSLAAFGALLQVATIAVVSGLFHSGVETWKDGTALHYALHVDRWVSGIGLAARGLPAGVLRVWTHLVHVAEWTLPIWIFLPVLRRGVRFGAALLLAIVGLTYGLLFDLGLWGWSIAASGALVLGPDWWDGAARDHAKKPLARTVVYDADCGVCLYLARVLARLDHGRHVTFRANDDLAGLPAVVTPELVEQTVVVIHPDGTITTCEHGIADAARVIPGVGPVLRALILLPGLRQLFGWLYGVVATRRHRISAALGMGQCGLPEAPPPDGPQSYRTAANALLPGGDDARSPAARLGLGGLALVREALALLVLLGMVAQTGRANAVPEGARVLQSNRTLEAVAAWPRMLARWDVLAAPVEDTKLVIDGQTKAGGEVDLLTGGAVELDVTRPSRRMGQLWASYTERIAQKEWVDFEKAFRDYLVKGGPAFEGAERTPETTVTGFDAILVTRPSPPPGSDAAPADPTHRVLFSHSRGGGGRTRGDRPVPSGLRRLP